MTWRELLLALALGRLGRTPTDVHVNLDLVEGGDGWLISSVVAGVEVTQTAGEPEVRQPCGST